MVSAADQVWSADITYVPMRHGFMYLVAILDWHSRYVLAWRLSNTLDSDFCVEALRAALRRGRPAIFNTDQGSQFTSQAFTGVLEQHGIAISMDGRGRALDNVFIERLWWSVKYEDVYLQGYETVAELKAGLKRYFDRYCRRRPHQSLDNRFPWDVYNADRRQTKQTKSSALKFGLTADCGGEHNKRRNVLAALRPRDTWEGCRGPLSVVKTPHLNFTQKLSSAHRVHRTPRS